MDHVLVRQRDPGVSLRDDLCPHTAVNASAPPPPPRSQFRSVSRGNVQPSLGIRCRSSCSTKSPTLTHCSQGVRVLRDSGHGILIYCQHVTLSFTRFLCKDLIHGARSLPSDSGPGPVTQPARSSPTLHGLHGAPHSCSPWGTARSLSALSGAILNSETIPLKHKHVRNVALNTCEKDTGL